MNYIQQKMDILSDNRARAFSTLSNKTTTQKTSEPYKTQITQTGNISISAFCARLEKEGIHIGRNQMFKWLRQNGYISKQPSIKNLPVKKYIAQGIMSYKETFVFIADEQVPKYSPLITLKGAAYFTKMLKAELSQTSYKKAK